MTGISLKRALDEAAKILANAKANIRSTSGSSVGPNEGQQQKQQILELGRLTHVYEANLNTITNYLPNIPTRDRERYPSYYSRMEEEANREIQEYESIMTIAEQNAAKAGLTNPKQEMAAFAQDCKTLYLDDRKKKQDRLSQIKIVIHSDGTITSFDTATNETARFDNQFNPID